jgi:hypothetical protein
MSGKLGLSLNWNSKNSSGFARAGQDEDKRLALGLVWQGAALDNT